MANLTLTRLGLRNSRQGFSVLELMTLVTVLSILLLFSRPLVRSALWNTELDAASRTLSAQIHAVRMKAISQNASFRLNVDEDSRAYLVEKFDGSSWARVGPVRYLPSSLEVVSADELVFYSSGILKDQGRIELKNRKDEAALVRVSAAGQVKVEKMPWRKGKSAKRR